jgi:hypothetical protein
LDAEVPQTPPRYWVVPLETLDQTGVVVVVVFGAVESPL